MSFSRSLYWWFFVFCAGLAFATQLRYDTWRRFDPPIVDTTYNIFIEPQPLSPIAAQYASFGAREFLADIYWLKLIQYYGGGEPQGKYRKLAELFNVVTDLSPKFLTPYQTGLLVLPGEGFTEEALALGEKGKRNLPNNWEVPYYKGLVYHIYKKDYVSAAKEFELAATLPNAPAIAQYFAALYYNQADERKTAYEIFRTVHDTTKDDFVRDRSVKYVVHLEGIFYLEDAVSKFRQAFGRNPSSLDELVKEKIIPQLPTSPLGLTYTYDSASGAIGEKKASG